MAAAARSFAVSDPGNVSLRSIAEAAGVNYGLVHRHFGSKADLVTATVLRHSARFSGFDREAEPIEIVTDMARHYLEGPAVARSLAWAAMNGADLGAIANGLADVSSLIIHLEQIVGDEKTARLCFAFAASAVLGVELMGDAGIIAAGGDPEAEHGELEDLTVKLMGAFFELLIERPELVR
jgi:AcrR family transcriptional regulator